MDFEEELVRRPSKARVLEIVQVILEEPNHVKGLMHHYFKHTDRLGMMASWIVCYVARKNPSLIKRYYPKMLKHIKKDVHTGIKRNTIRIFEDVPIPEKIQSELYEICLEFISDTKSPMAVAAFSMTTALRIARPYPELREELKEILFLMDTHGTSGFQYRRKKTLKELDSYS